MAQIPHLISTKLHTPVVRASLVARPRLTNLLNQLLQTRLTVIAAPAGFGKTTILMEWCATDTGKSVPLAWFSLDENDQDAVLFWAYVITALDKIAPGLTAPLLSLLCTPQIQLETVVTDLINSLSDFEGDFVLVLDDYHLINNLAIHQSLLFLLERLPNQMHLVITSRADPPLHLPRLRVRRQLTELRVEDLRFSLEETQAFLQMMKLQLQPEQIAVLEERTEGWIAGLQLAALSMQQRPDLAEFVTAFTGSNRYVLDYVLEEVLQQQPARVQEFLLYTSILDRLNGPLCEAVTGQNAGHSMLEALERANMFLLGLDDKRDWYRYHHLFAQLLRYRLQQIQPEIIPTLYRRAGEWCVAHHLNEEAIQYFLSGEQFEQAATALEQLSRRLIEQGRLSRLIEWVDKLPAPILNYHPLLYVNYAWALSLSGQVEISQNYLTHLEQAGNVADIGQNQALGVEIATFQTTIVTSYQLDFRRGSQLIQQVLAALPPHELYLRSYVLRNQGEAYLLSGDLPQAEAGYQASIKTGEVSGNNFTKCAATYGLGLVRLHRAELKEAAQLFRQTLQTFDQAGNSQLPITSYLYIGLAGILAEWNELHTALEYVQKGLVLAQQGNLTTLLIWGYTLLAYIKQALGDEAGAVEAHFQGLQHVQKYKPVHYQLREAAAYARVLLMQNNLAAANSWAVEYLAMGQTIAQSYSYLLQDFMELTLARVWLANNQPTKVLDLLLPLQKEAQNRQDLACMLEINTLQSLALSATGKHKQAVGVFINVLQKAEPSGYIRLFVDFGDKIVSLLKLAQLEPTLSTSLHAYSERLLQVLEVSTSQKPLQVDTNVPNSSLSVKIEPNGTLTERELEVLNLLNIGHTPPEIATRLVISAETARKHIKNIYNKLNAHSRFEALVRATERNLL